MEAEHVPAVGDLGGNEVFLQADGAVEFFPAGIDDFPDILPIALLR